MLVILVVVLAGSVSAGTRQSVLYQPLTVTASDYARAEKFLPYNADPLVYPTVRPHWLPNGSFWYTLTTASGSEFMMANPAVGTRAPAFDHARLATALSTASGSHYDARQLPFRNFALLAGGCTLLFVLGARRWRCDLHTYTCGGESALSLYDLRTGRLKHPITTGHGNVTQLLRVNE